jgi:hypothetical protein
VRRQLGIKLEGSTFPERWLIIDLEGKRIADLGGTASTEELCCCVGGRPVDTPRYAGPKEESFYDNGYCEFCLRTLGRRRRAILGEFTS